MSPFINLQDKRTDRRIRTDAMMQYLLEETEQYFGGDICNLSPKGLCFETGYFVRPGAVIKIKIDETEGEMPLCRRIHNCHAQVRWCETPAGVSAFSYRVGVEFL